MISLKVSLLILFLSLNLASFSFAQSKHMAGQCDIWGIDFSAEPLHGPYIPVTSVSLFNRVWKKVFGLQNTDHEGGHYVSSHINPKFLCIDGQAYTLSVILNSETERMFPRNGVAL